MLSNSRAVLMRRPSVSDFEPNLITIALIYPNLGEPNGRARRRFTIFFHAIARRDLPHSGFRLHPERPLSQRCLAYGILGIYSHYQTSSNLPLTRPLPDGAPTPIDWPVRGRLSLSNLVFGKAVQIRHYPVTVSAESGTIV
jgi:hypothetical protein